MHESAYANKIIYEANKHGDVKGITLEVGELAPVPAKDLVEFMRRAVSWQIKFVEKENVVECDCGFKGRAKITERGHDYYFIECPECSNNSPDIVSGEQIKIVSVDVD